MMRLTWDDAEEIAELLEERHPEVEPLAVRFTDLHRWVTELPGFEDDATKNVEGKVERIQMEWYEERRED